VVHKTGRRTVLVLGGYGQTGRVVTTHLAARNPDLALLVAGRDGARAAAFAATIDHSHVSGAALDASQRRALADALADVDLIVNVAAAAPLAATVCAAALDAGVDWVDAQVSRSQADVLAAAAPRITRAGLRWVTQAGFHPGLPAALVRLSAQRLDTVTAAWTSGLLHPRGGFPPSGAAAELFDEFAGYSAHLFRDGRWARARWTAAADAPVVTFAGGLGSHRTYPFDLDEIRALPDLLPDLHALGFGVSGFDPVTDVVVTPLLLAGARLGPWTYPALERALVASTARFGREPYGVAVQCDAVGTLDGRPSTLRLSLRHDDAYELTGIPVVSVVEQVLDGSLAPPGLHLAGLAADPARLVRDCADMGVTVAELRRDRPATGPDRPSGTAR
jgi:saccharopine dehydrogenase (NAD+, L-lysine-forming)